MTYPSRFCALSVVILAFLAAGQTFAAPMPTNSVGLGLMVGEPTGFSGAYTLSPTNTIDAALAYSLARQGAWQLHSDYLFTNNQWFQSQPADVEPYFGLGARLKFEDSTRFGARVPVGANYQFPSQPIEFFGEIVPILDFAPGVALSIDVSVGARYFF
jgi:hypothetical protein